MEWLLLLLFIGPAIYLYGCKMQRDMDRDQKEEIETRAHIFGGEDRYYIPGLDGSDIRAEELEKLR